MELTHLCIDKASILGIRDLETARALEKWNLYTKRECQLYKLQDVAAVLLGREIQRPGNHNSQEDARAVYDIYQKIEDEFIDDFNPGIPSISSQNPLDVVERTNPIVTVDSLDKNLNPSSTVLDQNNINSGWKDPIENILQAWNGNPIDLDDDTPEIEIWEEELSIEKIFNPSAGFVNIAETNMTQSKAESQRIEKNKLQIAKDNATEVSPDINEQIIYSELIVNGRTFKRRTEEIEYVAEDGQIITWKFKKL